MHSLVEFDTNYYAKGYKIIAGTDEAGRGPLAGPVVAAAVIMPLDKPITGINDSKKLNEKQREILFPIILNNAISVTATVIDNKKIDELNILRASLLSMKNSIEKLRIKPDIILIDGNKTFEYLCDKETIVKGDSKSYSIACASIIAKVVRDRLMAYYAKKFPEYQWNDNKGYPTKKHYELIAKYGITELHRKSFLRKFYEQQKEEQLELKF